MISRRLLSIVPEPVKKILHPIQDKIIPKYKGALVHWKKRFDEEGGVFSNSHYRNIFLNMAEEKDESFVNEKVVADFGSGPRGSLVWAKGAKLRIGIDVLADVYVDEFRDNMISHNMMYLKSTEKAIPLPTASVDVMFTLNAIDHVNSFSDMCNEIIRVIKPGGLFIGSFNLEGATSPREPQRLNEQKIKDNILDKLHVLSYRVSACGPKGNTYAPFLTGKLSYQTGREGYLWVKAQKPN